MFKIRYVIGSVLVLFVILSALLALIDPDVNIVSCEKSDEASVTAFTAEKICDQARERKETHVILTTEGQKEFAIRDFDSYLVDVLSIYTVPLIGITTVFALTGACLIGWFIHWINNNKQHYRPRRRRGVLRPIDSICQDFFNRSEAFRKKSLVSLAFLFVILIGGSVVFFKAASFAQNDVSYLQSSIQERGISSVTTFILKLAKILNSKDDPSTITISAAEGYWFAFVLAVRLGDVAFTSFLTYMCLRIYEYNLRMSAFFASRYDSLRAVKITKFHTLDYNTLCVLLDANYEFDKKKASLSDHLSVLLRTPKPDEKPDEPKAASTG